MYWIYALKIALLCMLFMDTASLKIQQRAQREAQTKIELEASGIESVKQVETEPKVKTKT